MQVCKHLKPCQELRDKRFNPSRLSNCITCFQRYRVMQYKTIMSIVVALITISFHSAFAEESCIKDNHFETIDCLKKKVPQLQVKLKILVEKAKTLNTESTPIDPLPAPDQKLSKVDEDIKILLSTQESWTKNLNTDTKEYCHRSPSGWESDFCKLEYQTRKLNSRIQEFQDLINSRSAS